MASPKKKNTEAKGNKGTAGGGGTGRFCKRVSAKRPVRRRVFLPIVGLFSCCNVRPYRRSRLVYITGARRIVTG